MTNLKMKGNFDHFSQEGITVLKPNHDEVTKLRDAGLIPGKFGSRIWCSSYLLIHYLSTLALSKKQNVVELGCGWGLPAAYLKKKFGAKVLATDADDQVEHYQQLISRVNGVTVPFLPHSFCQLILDDLTDIDLLMGADICYSATNAKRLAELCYYYLAQGKGEIIIADSGRVPFFNLVDEMKQTFALTLSEVSIDLPTRTSGYILHLASHP
ncbi:MAG: putative nicotinamide N-methyase [Alteromonadaceae bacterium]|jgi:predicted nicotinamide N-methyase